MKKSQKIMKILYRAGEIGLAGQIMKFKDDMKNPLIIIFFI